MKYEIWYSSYLKSFYFHSRTYPHYNKPLVNSHTFPRSLSSQNGLSYDSSYRYYTDWMEKCLPTLPESKSQWLNRDSPEHNVQ